MSSFADLIKQQSQEKKNSSETLVTGKVIGETTIKNQKFFVVDASLKYEGIVPFDDIKHLDHTTPISFMICGEREGYFLLSYEKARREINIKKLRKLYEEKEPVEVKIVAKANDGYKVLIFGETSGILQTQDTKEIGDEFPAFIAKIFNNGNINLAMTPSKVSKVKEGTFVTGTVLNFNDYFVFVEVHDSELEGILHVQDLSWEKVNFPGELVSQGQQLRLKVLKVQNKCMYLGLKQTQENPWAKARDLVKIGETYAGEIKAINDYELIVELDNHIQGNVHISESSWGFKKGSSLVEDFKIGEKIKAKVIDIDVYKHRIKLSLKQLLPNPFFLFAENHKIGDIVEGTVLHDHTSYGSFVFVELISGVDGMLHQSEMAWNSEEGMAKFTSLDKGQKIQVKITNIDMEKLRISVSVKKLNPDFFETASKDAQIGKIYDVQIIETTGEGAIVAIDELPGCVGFIKKNELSSDKNVRFHFFSVGNKLQAKLTGVHNLRRSFLFSVKAQQVDANRDAIKQNQNTIAFASFGSFVEKKK